MRKASFEFLKTLVEAPSPSGFEAPARAVYKAYCEQFADEVTSDVMGNCIAAVNPGGYPRIMLAGHMDEVGFIVKYIDDDGYLFFDQIGGVDPAVATAQRVWIQGKKGPVLGLVGRTAIHLTPPEERGKAAKLTDMWIDIGAKNKKEAEELVAIGDPLTYTWGFQEMRNDLICCRGFDDKVGSFVVAEALRLVAQKHPKAAVFAVATVQEEVGLRGARTSAYGLDPQIGVAVDVTFATDYPSADKKKVGDIVMGKGPVLSRGANISPIVFEGIKAAATKAKLSVQFEGAPGGTGTDANAIQLTRAGVATGLVSIPNRYMHSPVEVCSLKDLENAAKLLAEYCASIPEDIDLRL